MTKKRKTYDEPFDYGREDEKVAFLLPGTKRVIKVHKSTAICLRYIIARVNCGDVLEWEKLQKATGLNMKSKNAVGMENRGHFRSALRIMRQEKNAIPRFGVAIVNEDTYQQKLESNMDKAMRALERGKQSAVNIKYMRFKHSREDNRRLDNHISKIDPAEEHIDKIKRTTIY